MNGRVGRSRNQKMVETKERENGSTEDFRDDGGRIRRRTRRDREKLNLE